MNRIRNVVYNNRYTLYMSLTVVALMWLVGLFAHDVIVAIDSTTESVAPLGTLTAYIGIYLDVCFFALQQGFSLFHLQVSMGQTRRGFFLEQLCVRTGVLLVQQFMIYVLYHIELWKLRIFYSGYEMNHLADDILMMFQPLEIFLITFCGLSISLLLIALGARFGAKANWAICVVIYLSLLMFSTKSEEIVEYLSQHPNTVNLLPVGAVAVGVVLLAAAWGVLRKQQV